MSDDDMLLLERWRAGDETSGNRLIARYYEAVFRMIHRRLRNAEAAQETTQRVFEEVLNKLEVIERDFGAYVRQIAYYKALRAGPRHPEASESVSQLPAPHQSASAVLLAREESKMMVRALRSLSIEDQLLLAWVYADHKTQREIAELLEVRVPRINGKIHRARKRLRRALEALEESALRRSTLGGFETWLASVHGKQDAALQRLRGPE